MEKILKNLLLLLAASVVSSEHYVPSGETCGSVDIRSNSDFKLLEGCGIVEGSLKIALIEYQNTSFPLLTEITGFLMIFKVSGIESLAQLFPNLVRVHGDELFDNYSVVIIDNPDLLNIGLTRLKSVGAAVRIEHNEMLCYISTIDWSLIVHAAHLNENYIKSNMLPEVCPKCDVGRNCWSENHSQQFCNCNGGSCRADGVCCDTSKSCLSCDSEDLQVCNVCRRNVFGIYPSQRCVESCPYRSFEFKGYRCVTTEECKNMNIYRSVEPPFIPFQGVCQAGCPKDFQIKYNVEGNKMSASCTPCSGKKCWRSCKPPRVIDSIKSAQKLRGCQLIEGSLNIQIKARDLRELENSLSDIIEIEDYLKIARSTSITSLDFLKNLRFIRGKNQESNKYAVIIFDNQNLRDLFTENQEIQIDNGTVFLHFNPNLCFNKIEKLVNKSFVIENFNLAKLSNGDKASCNITKFNVEIDKITFDAVSLRWAPLLVNNKSSVLSYVVQYVEAPNRSNDSLVQQDFYNDDGWFADDIIASNSSDKVLHQLTGLKPFTQYGFYVKAYTLASARVGGQSDFNYFRTLPGRPEKVEKLKAEIMSSAKIQISWKSPINTNGELEGYKIKVRKLQRDFVHRDFCKQPLDSSELQIEAHEIQNTNLPQEIEEGENFEDKLEIYIRNRSKRSTDCRLKETGKVSKEYERHETVVPNTTEYIFNNLDHYSWHVFLVKACRKEVQIKDLRNTEDKDEVCSEYEQVAARTSVSETADEVKEFLATLVPSNKSIHDVKLSWLPPQDPNGVVLHYVVQQVKHDVANSDMKTICVSLYHTEHICSKTIASLVPGNYSFKMSAITLAGQGNFTAQQYVYISSPSHLSIIASPSLLGLLFLVLLSILALVSYTLYKRNQPPVNDFENFGSNLPINPNH